MNEASKIFRLRFEDKYFELKQNLKNKEETDSVVMLEDLKLIYNEIIDATLENILYVENAVNDLDTYKNELKSFVKGLEERK
jgi:hypothetical protein|tara:strand:+ start:140 stop:385 length:246 start_codon:yes stop_codon:yes gene_type:complete